MEPSQLRLTGHIEAHGIPTEPNRTEPVSAELSRFSHYCASKAAVIAFTRCLSLEIGARHVVANCVAPGAIRTTLLADV